MNKTLLQIKNLTKSFGGLVAVNDLSFSVEEKSIHALIGPNGSGKTTTLNMIAGELMPDSGSVLYQDQDLVKSKPHLISRMGLSRKFQNIRLFSGMTALENIMIGIHRNYPSHIVDFIVNISKAKKEELIIKEKAIEILNFLGLYRIKDEKVENLAYGNQKVLELGRALISNPKLILLDEPAAGLNPSERADFVNLLKQINNNGITLLLIEHNMDVVMDISNTITVLNFGKKIAEAGPKEIQNDDSVIDAYLGSSYRKKKEQGEVDA